MEDGVDFPLGGSAEVEGRVQDDFLYFKWTSPSHLEFLGSIHVKIGGFQPNLVSYLPQGVFGGYSLLHPLLGKFVSCLSVITSSGQVGELTFQIW